MAVRRGSETWQKRLVRRLTIRLPTSFDGLLYPSGRKLPGELLSKRTRVSIFLSDLPVLNVMGMLTVMVN